MADGAERTPLEATGIELMLRVREGDVVAFRELARRYREPLRRYFLGVISDRSLADDYVQDRRSEGDVRKIRCRPGAEARTAAHAPG